MKTMKQLLIVIGLVAMSTLSAQHLAQYPQISMQSTSTMVGSGSSIHLAATDMQIEREDVNSSNDYGFTGPKKARPEDNKDPGLPIGDAVLPLLLLAVGYAIYLRRKNSVRTSDSGHQQ